jgi:hypothetical protein
MRYDQITQDVVRTDDAWLNAQVCRAGALDQFATAVLKACDRALKLEPDNGIYHDSRGLVRALSGNAMGAAADFTSFIDWMQQNNLYSDQAHIKDRQTWIQERDSWISALLQGINPIDSKALHALQSERFYLFASEQCYTNGCPTPLYPPGSP